MEIFESLGFEAACEAFNVSADPSFRCGREGA